MKVINIEVTDKLKVTSITDGDKTINSSNPIQIASGNYKSIILNFTFDSKTWSEETLTKYATFNIEGQERIQVGLEAIDEYPEACYIPYNVLKQNCRVNVGVYGNRMYNGQVQKVVSSENLYFLVIDGAFSVFLSDETPPKIDTMEEQMEDDLNKFIDNLTKEFNDNYQKKLDNLNSNILDVEGELENKTGITFDKYADSKRIENAISNYFSMTPDYGIYTVKFPLWDTSNTSAGEKLDDNKDLSCTPATDTEKEVSNYGSAWDSIDCNAEVDDNGVRHITSLKGMCTFRDVGRVDVFCLFRTYWQKIWEEDGYLYISRSFVPREGYTIVPQAVNKDGTYNQWFLIGKYVVGDIPDEGTNAHHLYSSKGLVPAHYFSTPVGEEEISDNISYSVCVTLMHKKGKYYSAGLMADYLHILTTFYLKFATRNTQSIMYGNTNNSRQYQVSKTESNVNRVIITKSQAELFDVNTYVSVGDKGTNSSSDRANGYMHNIANNVKVIKKEEIDDNNTALVLEHKSFNTTTTTYVSTMHERSGYSDNIKGRTGSVGSNTNGRHGMVLDGIELMVGGYEVAGNVILKEVDTSGAKEVYYNNDASKLITDANTAYEQYKKLDFNIEPEKTEAWNYITEMKFNVKDGLAIPTKAGISGSGSAVGYADALYIGSATSTTPKELLLLGYIGRSTNAGLSFYDAGNGLAYAGWHILARLSINGVGVELAD